MDWTTVARMFVGGTFAFSGTAKLFAPAHTADTVARHLAALPQRPFPLLRLHPYKHLMAGLLIAVELGLGTMALLNCKPLLTWTALSGLTLFFAALTLYVAWQRKLATCGCVGRVLTLTPWQSFFKNVLLLVALAALMLQL